MSSCSYYSIYDALRDMLESIDSEIGYRTHDDILSEDPAAQRARHAREVDLVNAKEAFVLNHAEDMILSKYRVAGAVMSQRDVADVMVKYRRCVEEAERRILEKL